jgi:hypothetical protein
MTTCESLCIFLPTGRTFTFRNVIITIDNETTLVFEYTAMSDGLRKTGIFQKQQFVGFSVLEKVAGQVKS